MRPIKKQTENTGTVKFCDRFDEIDYPTSILNLYYKNVITDVRLTNKSFSKSFKFIVKDGQLI